MGCRKTKTKAIALANDKGHGKSTEPSKIEANTCSRHKARENVSEQVKIGFAFTSEWMTKWHNLFKPIA